MAAENANLSSSLEDYLEAIFNLLKESNIARSKDIAESLGVSRASVTGALRVLKEKGLANYKPYDYITLTETGRYPLFPSSFIFIIRFYFSSLALSRSRFNPGDFSNGFFFIVDRANNLLYYIEDSLF